MNLKLFLLIILFSLNLNARADNELEKSEIEQSAEQVIHQFHEEIEGHSEQEKFVLKNSIKKWLNNFNLLRISAETHRWVQMKYYRERDKSEYIRNLPVLGGLYLLSHTLEVFSGPIGVYVASDLGLPSSVQMLIGTIGVIISIPGLDPICLMLFAVSPLKPVQKAMSKIRILTVKVTNGIKNKFELQGAMDSFFQKKDRLAYILSGIESEFQIKKEMDLENETEKTEIIFPQNGKNNFLKVVLLKDAKANWIDSIEYSNDEALIKNKDQLMRFVSKMNMSARQALNATLFKKQNPFYAKIETLGASTKIQFSRYAVVLKPKFQFRTETYQCSQIFN